MNDLGRVAWVESAVSRHRGDGGSFCSACVEILEVGSVGVSLMSGRHSASVCHSDDRARVLDEAQFSLGEGPSIDAFASGEAVYEPDLGDPEVERWPMFAESALELGTRGVVALPLNAGQRCIGVLTLYHDVAGVLSSERSADGSVVADVVAQAILEARSGDDVGLFADAIGDAVDHRAEVHQASGMVAVQLGVGVGDAAARVRAHAYAEDRSVVDVARDIVERRLRLDDDRPAFGERSVE